MSEERGPLRRPWSASDRPVPRYVVQPLQAFLDQEAAGAILLLAAVVVALVWANSPWGRSYDTLWHSDVTIRVGAWSVTEDLSHVVNDLLMALFFFVVGLEIKRELLVGELRDRRAAVVPVVAALGGMVVPALIYLAVDAGHGAARGWGVPMATDIAFALGVLILAGRGLPPALRSFLLTLAIVDDIGAIVVIALFYTRGVHPLPLVVAVGLLVLMLVLRRLSVRASAAYVLLAASVWVATFVSGIHATIAGVALAFVTPAVPFQPPAAVSEEAHRIADLTEDHPATPDADAEAWLRLSRLSKDAVSPLARLEDGLHPWTTRVVIPIFALANAGVDLSAAALRASLTSRVTLGIVAGLVLGKLIGVAGATGLIARSSLGRLPHHIGSRDILGVAATAGIGFTVSLFIAALAFRDRATLDQAKIGILAGSILAGLLGATLLTLARRARRVGPL